MAFTLYRLLSLHVCIVAVIQLASSQSTWDIIQPENDVGSCAHIEQSLNQLMNANSQLMMLNYQLMNAVSQLQKDVAELKSGSQQKDMKGK